MPTYRIIKADQTYFSFSTDIPYLAAAWKAAAGVGDRTGTHVKYMKVFLEGHELTLDMKELKRYSKSYNKLLLNPTIKIPSLTTAENFLKNNKNAIDSP